MTFIEYVEGANYTLFRLNAPDSKETPESFGIG